MSGPLCPPLDDTRRTEPAGPAEGFAAPNGGRHGALLLALLAAAGLALAGGSLSGFTGALAGGAAGLLALGLLARRTARLEAALKRTQARADAAEAESRQAAAESLAKSRFLAEMSHELRTPLNTVMGFSEMMAEEVLGPHRVPAYGGYARDIHASGRHLLALADDLLDLARIESGHRTLVETPVRLDRLAEECLAMVRPQATARGIALGAESSPDAPRLWGDERALRQIALNLLANAVKFTPAGGCVRLLVGIGADGGAFIAVEDSGPGIADDELPLGAAHPRESRLDLATGRGAGLGLAIARGLAALHGGSLELTRRSGGGTRALIRLPEGRTLPAA
ncbi:HAMP domain-containing sensor histidine kinase [Xanthobacter sp. KR7-65]|uniref:sensor histidine kinase n=1 Tax=Xanthobacter sp. KR7-65 TaxID=3156612 RepID=UPI0032B4B555